MKKLIPDPQLILPGWMFAQKDIKTGLNFENVTIALLSIAVAGVAFMRFITKKIFPETEFIFRTAIVIKPLFKT
jgi:hypothetical protein